MIFIKKYLKNFDITEEIVRECIYDCLEHNRWKRRDTSYMLAEYYEKMIHTKIDTYFIARALRSTAYRDKTELYPIVDFISSEIYKEIKERRIKLEPIAYQTRKDHSNGKIREIGISSMKQQLYDYIAVNCCKKMFMAKIGTYQCSSIKGRGQLYGKKAIERWFHRNPKKCKWIVQCDIKKYYPSVNKTILKSLLFKDIANKDVIYILNTLIDSYKNGLCIGSYLSQYLANYLLSYAYHYIDEHCFKIRRGKRKNLVWKKLFYADDVFMCGSDKRDVKLALKMLENYLSDELDLSIKSGWKLHNIDSFPTDMMGYKIGKKNTTVRTRIFSRADKLYRKYKDTRIQIPKNDARTMISYYGYFKHSNSKNYMAKTKVDRTLNNAKELIRYETCNNNNK